MVFSLMKTKGDNTMQEQTWKKLNKVAVVGLVAFMAFRVEYQKNFFRPLEVSEVEAEVEVAEEIEPLAVGVSRSTSVKVATNVSVNPQRLYSGLLMRKLNLLLFSFLL